MADRSGRARPLNVMRADSLPTARKIRQPIESPGDIGNAFDGITYGKGEAVIGMFENYVGPKKFQQAIRLYLLQHAWRNATAGDLLAAVDSGGARNLSNTLERIRLCSARAAVVQPGASSSSLTNNTRSAIV